MEDKISSINTNSSSPTPKHIRCIIKLGGSAITCKDQFETINEEKLSVVSAQLCQAMDSVSDGRSFPGLDWSKRTGDSGAPLAYDEVCNEHTIDFEKFVVVHGAGSFGHFQASKSRVHKGGLQQPLVKAGFVATRISVTSLNLEIVRTLAREGIPSIGMSPFSCGWSTCNRDVSKMTAADISMVADAIDSGFVPVLHGDAVLDTSQDCTILSGDIIIRFLAAELKPDFVVFLTDVFGVFDRPPTEPGAVLLREIAVKEDGSWSVVQPVMQKEVPSPSKSSIIGEMAGNSTYAIRIRVVMTVAAHDTTGGMVTKISEAAMIAKLGIDVYIVKAATEHSLTALNGTLKHHIPENWLGTVIRLVK